MLVDDLDEFAGARIGDQLGAAHPLHDEMVDRTRLDLRRVERTGGVNGVDELAGQVGGRLAGAGEPEDAARPCRPSGVAPSASR